MGVCKQSCKKIIMFHASVKKVLLIVLVFMLSGLLTANANELYFIDVHSQVYQNVVPFNKIISLMDDAGVHQTILSTRRNLKEGAI
jgi:hypothetical protein